VESTAFQVALQDSLRARQFAAELEARDDRGATAAGAILEGAGVTATGRTKKDMLRWIVEPKSEATRTKCLKWVNQIADFYVKTEPTGQITGRTYSQKKTDALKAKADSLKRIKREILADPELSVIVDGADNNDMQ
jgi:hypothetical protein